MVSAYRRTPNTSVAMAGRHLLTFELSEKGDDLSIYGDAAGLRLLAELHQRFWTAEGSRTKASLSAEIRQQEARFGLSPLSRRQLQWSIDKGDTAQEKTTSRRWARALTAAEKKDPRDVLKVVRDALRDRVAGVIRPLKEGQQSASVKFES